MNNIIQTFVTKITQYVWDSDLRSYRFPVSLVIKTARMVHCITRDLSQGQLTLLAMSLVYTTLLSLVPMLAVSFSVLKAFGVHNQIEPLLYNITAPMGDKGVEIVNRILGFVDNINAGALGAVGLGILLYTVVSMLQKTERAFNYIWKVNRPRRFTQRFSDYLSVILVGPVLIFTAIGVTASIKNNQLVQAIQSIEPFGSLIHYISLLLPYLLVILAFSFIYIFIPNTRVRYRSAFIGAIVSGILWEGAGLAFASFVASSTTQTAIYSSFAILIFFIIWLYLGWVILLIGASVSFYHQNPLQMTRNYHAVAINNHLREHLALLIMHYIGDSFYRDRPAWTVDAISAELSIAKDSIHDILDLLEANHIVTENADEPPAYLPARAMDTIKLMDILDAVRIYNPQPEMINKQRLTSESVDQIMDNVRNAIINALAEQTLKDMVINHDIRASKESLTEEHI